MIERTLKEKLMGLAAKYPIVTLTGPRQSGKSTLLKYSFPEYNYPKSVIRDRTDFVLLPCRLSVAFVEGVAGHVETKQRGRCRQEDESGREAE